MQQPVMKPILTAGKTNHCGRCHTKRLFWLEQDGLYYCEACGLMLVDAENVTAVTEAGFEAYRQHVPYGEKTNDAAVVAARQAERAKNQALTEAQSRALEEADYENTLYSARMGTGYR